MGHDVFISYSTKDKPTADAVCATLESRGVRCWIAPRDILPGMDWGESLVEGIKRCRVMVLVFSSHANASPQIKREVERAVSKGVPIIPFRIEEVLPTRSLEYFISTPHWMDAMSPPLERHLEKLADVVRTLLSKFEDRTTKTVAGWAPAPVAKAARWLDTAVFKGRLSREAVRKEPPAKKEEKREERRRPAGLLILLAATLLLVLVALLPLRRAAARGDKEAGATPPNTPSVQDERVEREDATAPGPFSRSRPSPTSPLASGEARTSTPTPLKRPPGPVSQVFECRRGAEFHVSPDETVVTIDGRRIGIADDWDGSGGGRTYYFRGSGTHYVRLSLRGYRTTWIKIVVRPGAEEEIVDVDTSLPELR
jgi:hypothetical protein